MKKARTPGRFQQTVQQQQQQQTQQHQQQHVLKTPRSRPNSELLKEPVDVYCRIRPMQSENDLACVSLQSSTTIILTPPDIAVNYKILALKETQCTFKHVFDVKSRQREIFNVVAKPLVENLLKGKNGLLFTYGVTGGGKTYTMTGNSEDRGIMPRCLDILFKTISDYQTKKFVFKPDRLNGFEVLSETDAMLERQADMNARFSKHQQQQQQNFLQKRKDSDPEIASRASTDEPLLDGIDEDNMFSVFITYIEIYNKSVFDLLEETELNRNPQSKLIREDADHNMYVHGVTEIEVKTVHEAIEAFKIGQKRKRMAHTILNSESSRSHSVFTIRLVQAPTDSQGEQIIQDSNVITVSQLSLVDLAGSERTNRTKNTGDRLREASNINNSLLTLRTCLETLRENQLNGGINIKKVPYRESKLTHLFKNYFDGEGTVRMVVCINPRAEDYDETAQVVKFAEMTQEVQIPRPIAQNKLDIGLTPGRRRANQIFKTAINKLEDLGYTNTDEINIDLGLVYSLGPSMPDFRLTDPENEKLIADLVQLLEQRIQKRRMLLENFNARQDAFRKHLLNLEKSNMMFKTENASLTAILKQERQKIIHLENKIIVHERSIDDYTRKLKEQDEQIKNFQYQLNQKHHMLAKKEMEQEKERKHLETKYSVREDQIKKKYANKISEREKEIQEKHRHEREQLQMVKEIIGGGGGAAAAGPKIKSSHHRTIKSNENDAMIDDENCIKNTKYSSNTMPSAICNTPNRTNRGVPVANVRRRSRSADDHWIEHRAPNPVPVGTILQPYYKNRKSVTQTEVKDFTSPKPSKYCLVSQQADTDGELETRLYKGSVIPTCGGGAQIIFNDVECLKQISPIQSPKKRGEQQQQQQHNCDEDNHHQHHQRERKRHSNSKERFCSNIGRSPPPPSQSALSVHETESRCNIGIEGHNLNKKQRT